MSGFRQVVAAIACTVVAHTAASAAPITFIHEGYGSGSIAGVGFGALAPAHFVITATGNTATRVDLGFGFTIVHSSATIVIDGVGSFDFTTPTRTFVNNATGTPGFSRSTGGGGGSDLYDGPNNAAFSVWDMLSSIGPINDATGELFQWSDSPVNTTGGVLVFNDASNVDDTFTAIVVPAPAILAIAPIPALALTRRRR